MNPKPAFLVCCCLIAGVIFSSCGPDSSLSAPKTATPWLQITPNPSPSSFTPTRTIAATAQTPTAIPPTASTTVPATHRPSPTSTITHPVSKLSGGAILGVRDDEVIIYGLREGTDDEDIYIININNLSYVESQKLISSSLKGEAFYMVVNENQAFFDDDGNEASVDFIAGWPMDTYSSNQEIVVVVHRTEDINSSIPIHPIELSGVEFAPPKGEPVIVQGWLELYAIQQTDTRLESEEDKGKFPLLLLHSGNQIYLLGFLPNYQNNIPFDNLVENDLQLNVGVDYEYLVRGFTGDSVSLWLQDRGTILQLDYLEAVSIAHSVEEQQIVFITDRDGYDSIYTMKGDGSNLTSVFSDPNTTPAGPVWSPDHAKIAFFSTSDERSKYDLFILNADDSDLIDLTDDSTFDAAPSWSPDGNKLAYTCDDAQGDNLEVCTINLDGSGKTNLTNSPLSDGEAHWSPDGSLITFYSKRDGNLEVYTMNADGSQQVRLTSNEASDWPASWSPDGNQIIFNTNRDGNYEIYRMEADGTNLTNLTNNPAGDWAGYFTDDGRYIIFESDRDGHSQLYVMNSDGSGQTRLLHTTYNDLYPDW